MKMDVARRRTGSWVDVLILALLSLALGASSFWAIPWLGSAAGLLLTFAMTGWLCIRIIFGERPFELEVEILLILFISAFLAGIEVLVLVLLQVDVTREVILIMVTATAWLLLIFLKVKERFFVRQGRVSARQNWFSLLVAVLVPLALFGFGLLHMHDTRENYTEFSVTGAGEQGGLTVVSHEEAVQLFSLVCQSPLGERTVLGNFEVHPRQEVQITISYSHIEIGGKLKIALDQHKGTAAYRWVEIPGEDCADLKAEVQ
jgi:hypothetical protein